MAKAKPKPSANYVALLRGINVGGKNVLPMKDLVRLFEAEGCSDVSTYIQSGNVAFQATDALAKKLPRLIATAIAKGFGHTVPVITRSRSELAELPARNPFLAEGRDAKSLHVGFLEHIPDRDRVAELDAERSTPDAFRVEGREIFLFLPRGVARTKLTNRYFDKALGTTSTFRNWRTALKLRELTGTK